MTPSQQVLENAKGSIITAFALATKGGVIFLELNSDGDHLVRIEAKNGELIVTRTNSNG